MPAYVPKAIYESERARVLYNVWRRMTLELSPPDAGSIPWQWEELDEMQRAAWCAVAAEPLDSELAAFVDSVIPT